MMTQNNKVREPKSNYRPKAVNNDVISKRLAYAEFDKYFDSRIFTSYSQWAKEKVHYNNCEDAEIIERLRSVNNGYTMSMGASVISAYSKDGIDLDNLFDVYVSYLAMHMNNKNFDEDMAKSMATVADNIKASCDKLPHGIREIVSVATMGIREETKYQADMYQKKAIDERLKAHDIDSLTMSARQIAAIKVNFMEQCYVDMREKCKTADDVMECEREYNTAVAHLEQIARNSGFDMGAVAAEERFIVGLKIDANPRYAIMFNETSGPYAAKPKIENGQWAGTFVTSDNHEYTVGDHPQMGAFTIRKPIATINGSTTIETTVRRHAEQFAMIDSYLSINENNIASLKKAVVTKDIQNKIDEYKNTVKKMLMDDGVVRSNSQAEQWWSENFEEPRALFRDEIEVANGTKFTTNFDESQNKVITGMTEYGCFASEMDRLINKDIILKQKQPYDEKTESAINSIMQQIYKSNVGSVSMNHNEAENNCEALSAIRDRLNMNIKNPADRKNSIEALMDCRDRYMDKISAHDISDMLMHTVTNMEQGWETKGVYQRTYNEPKTHQNENSVRAAFNEVTVVNDQAEPARQSEDTNTVVEANVDMSSIFGDESDFLPPCEDDSPVI